MKFNRVLILILTLFCVFSILNMPKSSGQQIGSTMVQLQIERDTIDVDSRRVQVTIVVSFTYDYNTSFNERLVWLTGCDDHYFNVTKIQSSSDWSFFQGEITTPAWIVGEPSLFPFDVYTLSIDVEFPISFNFTTTSPTAQIPYIQLYLWEMSPIAPTWEDSIIHFNVHFSRVEWQIIPQAFPAIIGFLFLGFSILIKKQEEESKLETRMSVYIALLLWFIGSSFSLQGVLPQTRSFFAVVELLNFSLIFSLVIFVLASILGQYWSNDMGRFDLHAIIISSLLALVVFVIPIGVMLQGDIRYLSFAIFYSIAIVLPLFSGGLVMYQKEKRATTPPSAEE